MRILLPVFLVMIVVLFALGAIAPRRSRRVQRWIDGRLEAKERRGDRSSSRVGDWLAKSLDLLQRAVDSASRGGRRVGHKARD